MTSALLACELRHVGGALARRAPGGGALDHLPLRYVAFLVAAAPEAKAVLTGFAEVARVRAALAPWDVRRHVLNFAEGPVDASAAFDVATWDRLRDVRRRVDPDGLFAASHEVPAAG